MLSHWFSNDFYNLFWGDKYVLRKLCIKLLEEIEMKVGNNHDKLTTTHWKMHFRFSEQTQYSPSLWHGFCPVKRTGKYFAKKWSEQKVLGIEVAGLYSTYQKYKRIDGPSSYQFRENWTWVFFPKKLQKSKLFSPKIRGFLWGQTWTVRTSNHPSNHPWKKIGGLLPRILSS